MILVRLGRSCLQFITNFLFQSFFTCWHIFSHRVRHWLQVHSYMFQKANLCLNIMFSLLNTVWITCLCWRVALVASFQGLFYRNVNLCIKVLNVYCLLYHNVRSSVIKFAFLLLACQAFNTFHTTFMVMFRVS